MNLESTSDKPEGKAPPQAPSEMKAAKSAPKPPFESQKVPFTSSSEFPFSGIRHKQQSKTKHAASVFLLSLQNGIWSQKPTLDSCCPIVAM